MSLNDFYEGLQLPTYFKNWFWFNVILYLFCAMLIMIYTDGQVTIKFIDQKFDFNQSIPVLNNNLNLSLTNPYQTENLESQLRRYYNSQVDKNHFYENLNFYLFVFIIPVFNIVYGLIIIFDGSIIPPKDLYTFILSKIRGVKK